MRSAIFSAFSTGQPKISALGKPQIIERPSSNPFTSWPQDLMQPEPEDATRLEKAFIRFTRLGTDDADATCCSIGWRAGATSK
jgi:hypothetical protein